MIGRRGGVHWNDLINFLRTDKVLFCTGLAQLQPPALFSSGTGSDWRDDYQIGYMYMAGIDISTANGTSDYPSLLRPDASYLPALSGDNIARRVVFAGYAERGQVGRVGS